MIADDKSAGKVRANGLHDTGRIGHADHGRTCGIHGPQRLQRGAGGLHLDYGEIELRGTGHFPELACRLDDGECRHHTLHLPTTDNIAGELSVLCDDQDCLLVHNILRLLLSASSMTAKRRLPDAARLTAASMFFVRLACSTRDCNSPISALAAWSACVSSSFLASCSNAMVRRARAATTRCKVSETSSPPRMNAASSHEASNSLVWPSSTCVTETDSLAVSSFSASCSRQESTSFGSDGAAFAPPITTRLAAFVSCFCSGAFCGS